jgi:hypothetical protein
MSYANAWHLSYCEMGSRSASRVIASSEERLRGKAEGRDTCRPRPLLGSAGAVRGLRQCLSERIEVPACPRMAGDSPILRAVRRPFGVHEHVYTPEFIFQGCRRGSSEGSADCGAIQMDSKICVPSKTCCYNAIDSLYFIYINILPSSSVR